MRFHSLLSGLVTTFFCAALLYLPFSYKLNPFYQSGILILLSFLLLILRIIDARLSGAMTFKLNLLSIPFLLFVILVFVQYMLGTLGINGGSVYPYATRVQFVRILSYWLWMHFFIEYCRERGKIKIVLLSMNVAVYLVAILALGLLYAWKKNLLEWE